MNNPPREKPYHEVDHFHCWQQSKSPACGKTLDWHEVCCLCAIPYKRRSQAPQHTSPEKEEYKWGPHASPGYSPVPIEHPKVSQEKEPSEGLLIEETGVVNEFDRPGWLIDRLLRSGILNKAPSFTEKTLESEATRFWSKVEKTDGCWEWKGVILSHGYGQFHFKGIKTTRVHRIAYMLMVGEIPEGLVLDHLCRVRSCVNPAHLEPVTAKENALRGVSILANNARKTNCDKGHEFTEDNTIRYKESRHCRTCRNEMQRRKKSERTPEQIEKAKEAHKEWFQKNKERVNEYARKRYQNKKKNG